MRLFSIEPDSLPDQCAEHDVTCFYSNFHTFKKMYEDQGKVFWLRVLFVFKSKHDPYNFPLTCSSTVQETALNAFIIYLHQQFIESGVSGAMAIMFVSFSSSQLFSPDESVDPVILAPGVEMFMRRDVDCCIRKDIHAYVSKLFGLFCATICEVMRRWLQEHDIPKKIDPDSYWSWLKDREKLYSPSCFELYCAVFYKKDINRMLMKGDAYNSFLEHRGRGCKCQSFGSEMNLQDVLLNLFPAKDKSESICEQIEDNIARLGSKIDQFRPQNDLSEFQLTSLEVIQPKKIRCSVHHRKCFLKIRHSVSCLQPYFCRGKDAVCTKTCDVDSKEYHNSIPHTWHIVISQPDSHVSELKRNVATLAIPNNFVLETYLPLLEKNTTLSRNQIYAHAGLESYTPLIISPQAKNEFKQVCRKFNVRDRLKGRWNETYGHIEEFSDAAYLKKLFDKALFYEFNFEILGSFGSDVFKYDICLGTRDIISGEVVLATSRNKGKQSKKKKKKVNSAKSVHYANAESVVQPVITCSNDPMCSNDFDECASTSPVSEYCHKTSLKEKESSLKVKESSSSSTQQENVLKSEDAAISQIVKRSRTKNAKHVWKLPSKEMQIMMSKTCVNGNLSEQGFNDLAQVDNEKEEKEIEENIPILETLQNKIVQLEKLTPAECKVLPKSNKNGVCFNDNPNSEAQLKADETSTSLPKADKSKQEEKNVCSEENIAQVTVDHKESMDKSASSADALVGEIQTSLKLHTSINLGIKAQKQPASSPITDKIVSKLFPVNGISETDKKTKNHLPVDVNEMTVSNISNSDISGSNVSTKSCKTSKLKLRVCFYCKSQESAPKSFHRCKLCKSDNFPEHHFYCSKQCQTADWTQSHRRDHVVHTKQKKNVA